MYDICFLLLTTVVGQLEMLLNIIRYPMRKEEKAGWDGYGEIYGLNGRTIIRVVLHTI
jgi:hypothetical protein